MSELVQPKLRFKQDNGITFSIFKQLKLVEISNIIMGQSPDSKSYNLEGEGHLLIQGNADIKKRESAPRQYTKILTKECLPGDILLTVRAPVGEVAKSVHKACIGRGVCAIRTKSIDSEFLYQFLIKFENKWAKYSQGSTFTAVNSDELKKLRVEVPSIEEQQKIASFLSLVDKKIELLTKKHELLEKYKKGLMQKIFSQEIRFKQDDGSDFPDWKIGILDNLIKKIADGGTPPTNDKSNFGGEINWVVIDDIQDKIEVTKIKLTEKGYKKCSSSLWEPEDIILSTGATIGEVGITKLTTATKQGICGIKVNKECCNIFLKEWFKSENARLQFKKYAQGSSIKEVRPPTLIEFKIIFPELAEQKKIGLLLSSVDKKIDLMQQQIEKTQTFKKGLLQQMFV